MPPTGRLSLDAASEPASDGDDDDPQLRTTRGGAGGAPLPAAAVRVLRAAPWLEPPREATTPSDAARLQRYVAGVCAALSDEQRRKLRALRARVDSELRAAAKDDLALHDAWLVRFLRGKPRRSDRSFPNRTVTNNGQVRRRLLTVELQVPLKPS